MKTLEIALFVLIRDTKVLMLQEKKHSAYGKWDCPGGKIIPGETPEEAVRRETREETGLEINHCDFIKTYEEVDNDMLIRMHVFTGQATGEIVIPPEEIMNYGWFTLNEIKLMTPNLRIGVFVDIIQDVLVSGN